MGRKNSFRPKEVLFETKAQRCAETINERVLAKNFCQDAYGDHFSASRTSAVPLKLRRHGAAPRTPASPMLSRGRHGRRLLARHSGRSGLQLGRDGTLGPPAAGLPPRPGSLRTAGPVRLRHRFSIDFGGILYDSSPVVKRKFYESTPIPGLRSGKFVL